MNSTGGFTLTQNAIKNIKEEPLEIVSGSTYMNRTRTPNLNNDTFRDMVIIPKQPNSPNFEWMCKKVRSVPGVYIDDQQSGWARERLPCILDRHTREYYSLDAWHDSQVYIQVITGSDRAFNEVESLCNKYHIPITDYADWSTKDLIKDYAYRFKEASERGMKCILLLHDCVHFGLDLTVLKEQMERYTDQSLSGLCCDYNTSTQPTFVFLILDSTVDLKYCINNIIETNISEKVRNRLENTERVFVNMLDNRSSKAFSIFADAYSKVSPPHRGIKTIVVAEDFKLMAVFEDMCILRRIPLVCCDEIHFELKMKNYMAQLIDDTHIYNAPGLVNVLYFCENGAKNGTLFNYVKKNPRALKHIENINLYTKCKGV